MDVRICDRLTQRQEGKTIGLEESKWINLRQRQRHLAQTYLVRVVPLNPGTHEQRTTLASVYVNEWNVAVWVIIGDIELGFMEYPNNGSITQQYLPSEYGMMEVGFS